MSGSNLYKQTIIYAIGNLAVKAFGFLILPIYTGNLDGDEYGMVILLEVMAQFFVGLVSLNIPLAMLRFVSDPEHEGKKGSIYTTAWIIIFSALLIFILVFLPLREFLSSTLFGSPDYKRYLTLLALAIGIEVMILLPLQLIRYKEKAGLYTTLSILKLTIMFASVYYFIAVKGLGVEGFLYGIITGNLSTLILTIPMQVRFAVPKLNLKVGKEMVAYGAPLALTTVSALLLSFGDRFIIKMYQDLESVAIYGLAWKLGSMINVLLINSYSQGFIPVAFKKFHSPEFPKFFRSNFMVFSFILIFTTLGIATFSRELVFLAAAGKSSYTAAVMLTSIIAFGFVFKGVHYFFNIVFFLLKTTKISAAITTIGMILNLALNFALIPFFGIYGAVYATILSYLLMAGLTYRVSSKRMDLSVDMGKVILLLFVAVGFAFAATLTNELPFLFSISLKLLLVLVFLLLTYRVVLSDTERKAILNGIQKARERMKGTNPP